MRNKFLISLILCFVLVLSVCVNAGALEYPLQNDYQQIMSYFIKSSGCANVQSYLDSQKVTSDETSNVWNIISFSQSGSYRMEKYRSAMLSYATKNKVNSAVYRLKYALALVASGSNDDYIFNTLDDSIGKQGIVSYIMGLHILNNGYISTAYDISGVVNSIASLQLEDGGWAINGKNGDVDVTAMAIQALVHSYNFNRTARDAVDRAIVFLSEKQLDEGDYMSYGLPNCESTAQVAIALTSVGVDLNKDSRFIKNGKTVFDGIEKYRLQNGTYGHKDNSEYSQMATEQVFLASVACMRKSKGQSNLFELDKKNPSRKPTPTDSSAATSGSSSASTASGGVKSDISGVSSTASAGASSVVSGQKNKSESSTGDGTTLSKGKTEKKNTFSVWSIVLIVLAAVALVGLIGGAVVFTLKKKGIAFKPKSDENEKSDE